MVYSDQTLSALKSEVEQTFGRSILTSKDCIQLSEELFSKTRDSVNANTLRRLFGLVKTNFKPSVATLNILARYCGCNSVQELPAFVRVLEKDDVVTKENVLHYLVNMFREIPVNDISNQTFFILSKHTILFFNRNPTLAHEFQNHMAKTKNGQSFYFERFINIDRLNDYYGNGLRRYVSEKKTTEAEAFTYSLLVFRYWLTMEKEKLAQAYQHIESCDGTQLNSSTICARYFASQLYYAHASGLPMETIMDQVQQHHLTLRTQNGELQSFPFFELIISEALVLTGYYNEALYYINYAAENYMRNLAYLDFGYYTTFDLLKGIALGKVGQRKCTEKIINSFNAKELCFLSKKYNYLLYYILYAGLRKLSISDCEHFKKLVKETGFVRLLPYLSMTNF